MEQAIKIAIENGYNNLTVDQKDLAERGYLRKEVYLLDPLFWRALGKGLGWDKQYNEEGMIMGKYGLLPEFVWKGEWHRFIDHLAEGKDINSFFEELTNNHD